MSQKNLQSVLPLRNVVVYPHMVVPLFVGRDKSLQALDMAMSAEKTILLVTQKNPEIEEPAPEDLYAVGTVAKIDQLLKLPDGTVKVLVEGVTRARLLEIHDDAGGFYVADIELLHDQTQMSDQEQEALMRSVCDLFRQYTNLHKKASPDVLATLDTIADASKLADTVTMHMELKLDEKQRALEIIDIQARLEFVVGLLEDELEVLQIEKKIRKRVKKQLEKSQREYYLNEQMKAIQKELDESEGNVSEVEELSKKIEAAKMPKEAAGKARSDLQKLKMMAPMSAEATVVRNYLDTLISVPWKKRSRARIDLDEAERILEQDHYGLEKVKERIIEYLAVLQRVKRVGKSVLCLVGAPGVGKTSLGRSIARATKREFCRMSLGGVRDEAEIRGHRRTYIGSMPGKIVQNLIKAKKSNPLFLLDEIDKMAMDFRGDPSSAMLEVLDPEQNHSFVDHYLDVEVDLSDVLFITTANSLNIPAPLLDRMEIIKIPGYTEEEKRNIAMRYLVARNMRDCGLKDSEFAITEAAVDHIIRLYTREAGVRSLDREIAKICRKVVKQLTAPGKHAKVTIEPDHLHDYLGVYRFNHGVTESQDRVGQVVGLAWTEVGGEQMIIEAAVMRGKGKVEYTGRLGEVMQESIKAAITVVRNRASQYGLADDFIEHIDIHIHVPEGATPKDGPSAGIGMCTALISALTQIPVHSDIAMTGEITLKGELLPIGGLKEKLLAAHRHGIQTVIIPSENARHLTEISDNILKNLTIKPVRWIDEVFELALHHQPTPLNTTEAQPNPAIMATGD